LIPLSRPFFDEQVLASVERILAGNQFTRSLVADQTEQLLCQLTSSRFALLTNSCTSSLHASLVALGVTTGDAVFVSSYSWQATANVIEIVGATPVFVDIDPTTFNMNPLELEVQIQRVLRKGDLVPRAVLLVHAFGLLADLPAIDRIAKHHKLELLEDAACALGAVGPLGPAGAVGSMGCFSFHPRKLITCGEGGAIITQREDLFERASRFCDHGRARNSAGIFRDIGLNYRLSEIAAALLLPQLGMIDTLLAERRSIAASYRSLLSELPVVSPMESGTLHSWQSYVIRLDDYRRRDDLISYCRSVGIELGRGTISMPFTEYFQQKYGDLRSQLPVLTRTEESLVSLPLFAGISLQQQELVVSHLKRVLM